MADSMEQFTEQAKAGVRICLEEGADRAAVIDTARIPFDKGLRAYCAANACGCYDKNWACPPGVGEPDEVIARAKGYRRALVFQAVGRLEDSFDFEGMVAAERRFGELAERIRRRMAETLSRYLLLTAGGCSLCPVCAKAENQPCRFPDRAISSLEAYCIQVSRLAAACGMPYHSGENTITNFGACLFDE